MALDALSILTSIAVILLLGVVFSVIANKLRIPEVLILILIGMGLGVVTYKGEHLIEFPELFLTSVSLLALAMIVFDSSARLRLREFDAFSLKALKLVLLSLILNVLFFSLLTYYLLGVPFYLCILLATILTGTSPDITLTLLRGVKHRALDVLKLESIFNTPLTVLLPFIVIDFIRSVENIEIVTKFIEQLVPFLTTIVAGIGAGIFVGLILFKLIQRKYSQLYSPLAVIIGALLTYVLAENLGGNGVLAVTTLGVFFGTTSAKEKITLLSVESVVTKALFILVFVLVGLIIKIPLTGEFFIVSGVLFFAYLLLRFIAVHFCFKRDALREEIFMTLMAPKGIATAAVVFLFAIYNTQNTIYYIPGISIVLDLTLAFILYTIILSAIVALLSKYLIKPGATAKEVDA